jgi:transcriptional regulator with XRE-family HTH domain
MRMSERGFGPDPVDLRVGKNVRIKRTEIALSQDYIADQLGLSLSEYQECEAGDRRFSPERLLKLARLIGVNPEDLFEGLPGAAGRGSPK